MTDKQIIIDGVDVHWCEHYTGNIGYLTDKNWTCRAKIQGTKCEDWSNCYFKRWQRKEQECEELKMKNRILETECNEMRDVCNEFEQYYELLIEGHKKLKQTLTEIKEIAEAESYLSPQSTRLLVHKILQKISECEGNDE